MTYKRKVKFIFVFKISTERSEVAKATLQPLLRNSRRITQSCTPCIYSPHHLSSSQMFPFLPSVLYFHFLSPSYGSAATCSMSFLSCEQGGRNPLRAEPEMLHL